MAPIEILCLANSKKHGGRCVAGLRTDGQGWVRPVTLSGDGALFPHHYTLRDGTPVQVLDVLRVDCRECRPRPHQPENWSISGARWDLVKRPAPAEVAPLLRSYLIPGPALLGSTNDRIPFETLQRSAAPASLALIAPRDLKWQVTTSLAKATAQVRARFRLGGMQYNLVVTDPVYLERLGDLMPGLYPPSDVGLKPDETILLAISLGEPFEGNCYKLVAGVISVPAAWGIGAEEPSVDRSRGQPLAPRSSAEVATQDVHLAEFVSSCGSPLAARFVETFGNAWEGTRSEEEATRQLREVMETVFRERMSEADRHQTGQLQGVRKL